MDTTIIMVANASNVSMSSPGFQFKQFYVAHNKCAMKVGTDGTLLGAMATAPFPPFGHPVSSERPFRAFLHPKSFVSLTKGKGGHADSTNNTMHLYGSCDQLRILDVGTGSGLVALMLAQRYGEAEIDAIDIDAGAVEQAKENFAASPWSERLRAHLARVQDWGSNVNNGTKNLYDLVVSNPPYFQNSLKNPNKGREMARHTDTLSYEELVVHSRRLLREDGCLWLILPAEAESEILRLGATNDMRAEKIVYVHPKPEKPAKRVILQLVADPRSTHGRPTADPREDHGVDCPEKVTFYIESAYSPRSEEYAELTKDFYL